MLARDDAPTAIVLWSRLRTIAADGRAAGASYTVTELLKLLRGEFELKNHPDFRTDWNVLQSFFDENRELVRSVIGSGLHVPRQELEDQLRLKITQHRVVALLGESGIGKSALIATTAMEQRKVGPVIWLDGSQYDYPNHTALAQALNLRHSIPEIIRASVAQCGLIVLDSVERFSSRALRLAAELISIAAIDPKWTVVMSCQSHNWHTTLGELFSTGLEPSVFTTVDVTAPLAEEILPAIRTEAPGVASLLLRYELHGVLCNLKVLDWVLTQDTLRSGVQQQFFVGESTVIDWIWDRWIGNSSDRHARAGLLIKVAEQEAITLGSSMNLNEMSHAERLTVGDLEDERLVRVRDGRIALTHDLLGDWARLQSLLATSLNGIEKIREVIGLPRWQRPVRLYAQRLLEQPGGTTRWKEALGLFQGNDSANVLAADSFLDALIFAQNAEVLLEQVWPELTANRGLLLRRFMKRFLYIATVPDSRVTEFAEQGDNDWLANTFRIPYVLYWYAPLRVFHRHAEDVSRLSLLLSADVVELWLRTIPQEWGGRAEAAKLALVLAREAQGLIAERVWFQDKADLKIYEALFHASRDYPEEVSQIALELCHRREESPEVADRAFAHEEKRRAEAIERAKHTPPEQRKKRRPAPLSLMIGGHEGPLREPAPDGPTARVAESFQAAVLNGGALVSLVHARPAIAREVLLAVCIDEPQPRRRDDDFLMREFGTTSWPDGHPAMYFRGPFLSFLRASPEQGLETVLRLVNYATERWAEGYLRGAPLNLDPDVSSLEIRLPNGPVRWTGVPEVFFWYRDIFIGSNAVVSALMALEKWLSDEIDQGRNIDRWLEVILEKASSVAFAGVLLSVGIRTPELLAGPLRPLLGAWPLYLWQLELVAHDDTWRIGLTSWVNFGERLFNLVVDWNSQPHRKVLLRETAVRLLLTNEGVREFFKAQRPRWTEDLARNPNEDLELLLAAFDPQNYSASRMTDGRILFQFGWPESLDEKMRLEANTLATHSNALVFPHKCRRIIEGKHSLSSEDLDNFWTELRALADLDETGDANGRLPKRVTIVSAGIAVLVTRYRAWLGQNADRETWCLVELKQLGGFKQDEEYSSRSISDTAPESFVAEAAIALMPELDEDWLRELAASGIAAFYYSSTGLVMKQAFKMREVLGDDFGRAVNLLLCWSGLRYVAELSTRRGRSTARLERLRTRLISTFVKRRLPIAPLPLERISKIALRTVERANSHDPWPSRRGRDEEMRSREQSRDRSQFGIDTEVVSNGFSFLGSLERAKSESDRATLIGYHSEILGVFLRTMPNLRPGEEVAGTPYEFDRWVLDVVAALIPQLESRDLSRSFWHPIMSIGPGSRYWLESFFHGWFMTGLQHSPSLATFGEHWAELIAYSLDSPVWAAESSPRKHLAEKCSRDLMSLGLTMDQIAKEEFIPIIESLAPLFERWAERWLSWAEPAKAFAIFLTKPAGRALLPNGIVWLNSAAQAYSEYQWRERGLDDALAAALRACWKYFNDELAGKIDTRREFLQLLNTLCGRLNQDALALRSQVSQFIPAQMH